MLVKTGVRYRKAGLVQKRRALQLLGCRIGRIGARIAK
jgi:hypothetical protein